MQCFFINAFDGSVVAGAEQRVYDDIGITQQFAQFIEVFIQDYPALVDQLQIRGAFIPLP